MGTHRLRGSRRPGYDCVCPYMRSSESMTGTQSRLVRASCADCDSLHSHWSGHACTRGSYSSGLATSSGSARQISTSNRYTVHSFLERCRSIWGRGTDQQTFNRTPTHFLLSSCRCGWAQRCTSPWFLRLLKWSLLSPATCPLRATRWLWKDPNRGRVSHFADYYC